MCKIFAGQLQSSYLQVTRSFRLHGHSTSVRLEAGHVAMCVDDCKAEHERFEQEGLSPNPVKEFHRDGALMARFFFVQDPDGYKVEVLERHGRYQ